MRFASIILLSFITTLHPCFAQEEIEYTAELSNTCSLRLFDQPSELFATVKYSDLYSNHSEFKLRWKHNPSDIDSFWISKANSLDTQVYTSNRWIRHLRIPTKNTFRAMAEHHLRERIFLSAFRYDDLELLAQGAFYCKTNQDSLTQRIRTARSNTWYTIHWNSAQPITEMHFFGFQSLQRDFRVNSWIPLRNSVLIPSTIEVKESSGLTAEIRVQKIIPLEPNYKILVPRPIPIPFPYYTNQK